MTLVTLPPGFNGSSVRAINNKGLVLVAAMFNRMDKFLEPGYFEDARAGKHEDGPPIFRQQPFLFDAGVMRGLGPVPGHADADHHGWIGHYLNNGGHVVGATGISGKADRKPGGMRALFYKDGTIYDLNRCISANSDWELKDAISINDHGQILGAGKYRGDRSVFLLSPQI